MLAERLPIVFNLKEWNAASKVIRGAIECVHLNNVWENIHDKCGLGTISGKFLMLNQNDRVTLDSLIKLRNGMESGKPIKFSKVI